MSDTTFVDRVTRIEAPWLNDVNVQTYRTIKSLSSYNTPSAGGFWIDVTSSAVMQRMRDRVFIGDAVVNTGRQTAPYGSSAISENVGTWFEKNSQAIVGSSNGRVGILGWSNLSDADTTGASIAVAGVARAKLAGGTSRSFYGDATRESGATTVYGLEVAGTNRGSNITGNSYSLTGGVFGLHLTMQQAVGYTVTNSDTAAPAGSAPGQTAINIGAGVGGSNQTWNMGIRFSAGSLTGCDGTTGTAQALQLAKGHEINWMASSTIQGAKIRSDVTASAGHDVSMIFEPDVVSFYATDSKRIFRMQRAASGVNNVNIQSAATGLFPVIQAEGDDPAVGIFFCSKSTGRFSFYTGDTAHEEFRVGGTSASSVNYLHAYGSVSGTGLGYIEAKGADTDIGVRLVTKGAGLVSFGTFVGTGDVAINGYITIKDAAGNTRKLATVA